MLVCVWGLWVHVCVCVVCVLWRGSGVPPPNAERIQLVLLMSMNENAVNKS